MEEKQIILEECENKIARAKEIRDRAQAIIDEEEARKSGLLTKKVGVPFWLILAVGAVLLLPKRKK